MRAVERIARFCERHLRGRYDLTVIDIYQDAAQAQTGDIVVAPTLVKQLPAPPRRVIGDMTDETRILHAVDTAAVA